ncbi:PREDICTED: serine/threonine-protein kinase 35-like [Branchiostoma belcheri]|uniref:Serine/threonine-protein kinase 35-like n=1 Tax=Branchiostoma belcheri TaxID=7741 RepID=A0A6P4Y4M0_BRABE|nr:PREDICTED: serine/threonine-protein kinase 35-like [Branchiostoma belcheri]
MAEQTAGDYIVLGKLGSGAFGTVFQGRHQWQGSTVALKRLNLQNSDHIETARRELEPLLALRSTPHFNIVMFWESFVYQGSLWLVLEYCDLGTLNDFILATPQNTALNLRLMTNITAAVTFLHDREIVHRDLKPENILLSGTEENPVAKVGDFGLAKVCGDAFPNLFTDYYMSEECGSYIFLAPEVTEGHYTKKCDIFAMGVIFAAMITRATRKDEEGSEMLVVVVTENSKDLTIGEALRRNPNTEAEISECLARAMLENTDNRALVDVCLRLLRYNYHTRPTASDVHEDMKQLQRGGGTGSQDRLGRDPSFLGEGQIQPSHQLQANSLPTHPSSERVEGLRQIQRGRGRRGRYPLFRRAIRHVRGQMGQRQGVGRGAGRVRRNRLARGGTAQGPLHARGRPRLQPAVRIRQISRNFPGGIQGFFQAMRRRVGEIRATRVISRILDLNA